jgi:hypothetical protein
MKAKAFTPVLCLSVICLKTLFSGSKKIDLSAVNGGGPLLRRPSIFLTDIIRTAQLPRKVRF